MNKSVINKIISFPIWLAELFTTAKSFRDNPLIGSPALNKLGLHVARLLLSHAIMRLRMLMLAYPVSKADRKSYLREGFVIKENFLPTGLFEQLEQEARQFKGEIREARQGDTLTHRAVLSPAAIGNLPALKRTLSFKPLLHLMRFTSGHVRPPLYYLENIRNGVCDGHDDPQKMFHADTFHPSMKCWLFIDDVTEDQGPYTYIPQSNRLTWKRLAWQYRMSQNVSKEDNPYHVRGSTRYTAEDLVELGLPEPISFKVPKNTLVIANVFGIHRRGDSQSGSTRLALWGDSRTNPFIPVPGISNRTINRLQYDLLEIYRQRADNLAARQGRASPWRKLDENESL